MKAAQEIMSDVSARLAQEDIDSVFVPIAWADEAIREVRRSMENYTDQPFLDEVKGYFKFEYQKQLPDARSIILAAVPSPKVRLVLAHRGREVTVYIPPTYTDFSRVKERISKLLQEGLEPSGHKYAFASLPLKLLAVRSGLAQYGRSNVTYAGRRGSFVRLMAFLTDIPIEDRAWHDLKAMDRCVSCKACQKTCPTGAIAGDRFQVHADRCLTYLNEREVLPFPAWVDPGRHNALIGCMECQRVCPANKEVWANAKDAGRLSEDETEQLLKAKNLQDLTPDLRERLQVLDLDSLLPVMARNLAVLLHQADGACP